MEEERRKKYERMQLAFLVLLALAICGLIVAIVIVAKNIEMFKANPIAFGVDKYNFDSCMCQQGPNFFSVSKNGFKDEEGKEVNLEEINLGTKRSDGYSGEE